MMHNMLKMGYCGISAFLSAWKESFFIFSCYKQRNSNEVEILSYKNMIYGKDRVRRNYSKVQTVVELPELLIAYSPDANTAAKIIYGFAKKNEKLVVKAGVVDGKVLNTADLKVVASLPDKNGMLSMLLSVLQAPIRNLACAVKAVADKN